MSQNERLSIEVDQVVLLSVRGELDDGGLARLRTRLDQLVADGVRFVAADLSQVLRCDARLFALLAEASDHLRRSEGWLRLVGVGAAVLDRLDEVGLPEVLLVYRASDWVTRAAIHTPTGAERSVSGVSGPEG